MTLFIKIAAIALALYWSFCTGRVVENTMIAAKVSLEGHEYFKMYSKKHNRVYHIEEVLGEEKKRALHEIEQYKEYAKEEKWMRRRR